MFFGLGGKFTDHVEYQAKLGLLFDLGPDADSQGALPNSDGMNAVYVEGYSRWLVNENMVLTGLLSVYRTTVIAFGIGAGVGEPTGFVYVPNMDSLVPQKAPFATWINLALQGGYAFSTGEAGLALNFAFRTDYKNLPGTGGYLLSFYPYLQFRPSQESPLKVLLQLVSVEEYLYHGIPLAGKNFPVMGTGFTLHTLINM